MPPSHPSRKASPVTDRTARSDHIALSQALLVEHPTSSPGLLAPSPTHAWPSAHAGVASGTTAGPARAPRGPVPGGARGLVDAPDESTWGAAGDADVQGQAPSTPWVPPAWALTQSSPALGLAVSQAPAALEVEPESGGAQTASGQASVGAQGSSGLSAGLALAGAVLSVPSLARAGGDHTPPRFLDGERVNVQVAENTRPAQAIHTAHATDDGQLSGYLHKYGNSVL